MCYGELLKLRALCDAYHGVALPPSACISGYISIYNNKTDY